MISYLLVTALSFYLLPLFIQDTGTGMMILLVVMPLICFVNSVFYGLKYTFNWIGCIP